MRQCEEGACVEEHAELEEREEWRETVVEDEVEAEEHATQGACVQKPCEVHSGSLIVCDGTQVMTMRECRNRA